MSPKRDDQQQIRANISKSAYSVLKRLAGIKDTTLSDVVSEAIDQYLESEAIKELIEYHKLK